MNEQSRPAPAGHFLVAFFLHLAGAFHASGTVHKYANAQSFDNVRAGMSYSRTSVRILEEDYEAFLRLLKPDSKLPSRYREWLRRSVADNKECVGLGGLISEVIITPADFSKYCAVSGLAPSYFNLEAYAIVRSSSK